MKPARLVVFLAVVACGGSPPPTPVTVAPVPTTAPSAPLDPLARMWPIAQPDLLVHVDGAGLRATALGAALVPALLHTLLDGQLGARVPAAQAQCFRDAIAATKEVYAGGGAAREVAIVRYDPARLASPSACFDGWKSAEVAGAHDAWSDGKSVATVAAPGILVFGAPELVQAALHGDGHDARALDAVALHPGEYARLVVAQGPVRADAALVLSDALFAARGSADLPEDAARAFVGGAASARTELEGFSQHVPGVDPAAVARLGDALKVTRDGKHVTFAFELREPPSDQARDLGVLAALCVAGVQKYIAESKEIEARVTIREISRDLVAWWEEEQPPPHKRRTKLVSFPAVPKDVPRGVAYASTPADWKAWAPLKFDMNTPQHYQYEIVAARDGQSAEIVARGDLNGDGKTSRFAIPVKVRKKDHTLEIGTMTTTDPDE